MTRSKLRRNAPFVSVLFGVLLSFYPCTLTADDAFDTSSAKFKKTIKDNSLESIIVSADRRFLLALLGKAGFTWDLVSKKIVNEIDLSNYDRCFVGAQGFIGTVELERESRRNPEIEEYHIDLLPAGLSKPTKVAKHVKAGQINYCQISPSGKQIAIQSRSWGDDGQTITVIDFATGKSLCRFASPEYLQAIAWTYEEDTLIVGNGAELQVFNLDGKDQSDIAAPRQTSALQTSTIKRICVTDTNLVLVGHDDENLKAYTFVDRKLHLRSTIKAGGRSDELIIQPDSHVATVYYAYGNGNGISLIDIDKEQILQAKHEVQFRSLCKASEDLDFVFALGTELRAFSLRCCLNPQPPVAKSPKNPNSNDTYYGELQFGVSQQELLRASNAGFSRWRADKGLIQVVSNHTLASLGLQDDGFLHLSSDLGYLVRGAESLYACRWDDSSQKVKNQLLLKFPNYPYSWDNNSQPLVRFHDDKNNRDRLAVLDSSGKLKKVVDPTDGWDKASLSPDSALIAISDSRSVSLNNISGKELFRKECDVQAIDPPMFSWDNQRIIFGPSQIDVETSEVELVYPFASITATAVSPSRPITAYGHQNGTVFLFNQTSKALVASLGQMDGPIRSICFHREGGHVAALDEHGSIYLWDIANLKSIALANPMPRTATSVQLPITIKSGPVVITIDGNGPVGRNEIGEALRSALRQVEK